MHIQRISGLVTLWNGKPQGFSCPLFCVMQLFFCCSPNVTPERSLQGNAECWALLTAREQELALECPGGRCGETQGSCTSLIDGLDPCQGNVGQRNRNGTWQQLQMMFKLHLCAVAGVISGSVSYLVLLLWNHRVRQGQVFLNCLLGFCFLPESLLSCSLN